MFEKELSKETRGQVYAMLPQISRIRPFCPIYEVDVNYSGDDYTVFLLLDKELYILYAIRMIRADQKVRHELITTKSVLVALANMIVYQIRCQAS